MGGHLGRDDPIPPLGDQRVQLLTRHLLDKAGAVASRSELAVKGWPDGTPSRNALDVRILRLRRRIEPYGLMIRTVRHRGYLLDPTGTTA